MKIKVALLSLFAFTVVFMSSCGKDKSGYWDQDEQNLTDRKLIEEYAEAHNLNGTFTSSGLYYLVLVEGGMARPTPTSLITVNYKGYYLDGELLDEGTLNDNPLQNLILGWQEGIQYIGKGGKIKLIIPSALAYGHNPPSGVRQDAVLVFDIELIDFTDE